MSSSLTFWQNADAGQAAGFGEPVHPRTGVGGGARKMRVLPRQDEADCGRGRSEASRRLANGVSPKSDCLPGKEPAGQYKLSCRVFADEANIIYLCIGKVVHDQLPPNPPGPEGSKGRRS